MSQAPARPFESLDHMFILHGLKAGLAGVLALFVAEALRLQYPEWSVFTVEWFVALSRTEETFVGIIAVLIITPLFRVRHSRLEFQRLASSAVDQLKNLTNAELRNIREETLSNSEVLQEQTAVVRKLLLLDNLLIAERRESLYFGANTAILAVWRYRLKPTVSRILG